MNQVQQTTVSYDPGLLNYCAAHAWDAIRKYYNESSTRELYNQVRSSVIRDVKRVFEGAGPIQLHCAWRQAKLKDRKYRASLKGKHNPTLRPWSAISEADREGFRLFVNTVSDRRDVWDKAQQLSRSLMYDDLTGIDTLIGKLLESKTEQDEKDMQAARIAYCVDVTRTTYNTFLQAIGMGRLVIDYDRIVPRMLSGDAGLYAVHKEIFGELGKDLPNGRLLDPVRVLFFTITAARDAFDRFQTARPAAPAPKKEPLTLSPWVQWRGKMVRIADLSNEDLEQALSQTRTFENSMTYRFLQNEKARRASALADKLDAALEHQQKLKLNKHAGYVRHDVIAREDGAE